MATLFVDRVDITQKLVLKIRNRIKPLAILLFSETGVGKTALSRRLLHLMQLERENSLCISIPMNPTNCASSKNNNDYAIAVFRQLYSFLSRKSYENGVISESLYNKFNFKNYIATAKNPKIKKHLLEFIDEKFIKTSQLSGDIFRDALDVLFQRIFKIGIFDEETIVEELEKNIPVVNDYIEYIFRNKESFVHIDNIQNIDAFSEKYLLEWICASQDKKNVFILEYTVSGKDDTSIARFLDTLYLSSAEIIKVGLSRLSENDVVEIAISQLPEKSEDERFKNNVKAHYAGESNGNIFELEKYILTYELFEQDIKDNALRKSLLLLDDNKKFILSVIILHDGKIPEHILKAILKQSDILLLDDEFYELISSIEYIEKTDGNYALKHASIIDVWKNCAALKAEKTYYVAYKCCEEYYSNILRSKNFFSISRERCISLLLNLYAAFDPQALIGLINELDEIAVGVLSDKEVWKKVHVIFESIRLFGDTFANEIYHIIEICLQCELYEKAQYVLENVPSSKFRADKRFVLYHCLIYSLREKHSDVLKYIENNFNHFDNETDRYFYLFKISTLRSLNQDTELQTLINFLRTKDVFTDGYTKGYFLRLAETYESRKDAIQYVRKSIKIFESLNDEEEASKSRISLSYLLAITGDLSAAAMEIEAAEKTLTASIRNRCIFNVNKAALLLLSEGYSDKVWDLLTEAEPLTSTVFNNVAIYINKLVCCIEANDSEQGNFCAEQLINEIQNEQDRHIVAIGAYDLYLYYQQMQQLEFAQRFYDIAYENRHYCNALCARLERRKDFDSSQNLLLSKPWHICFLSYWDIDLKFG